MNESLELNESLDHKRFILSREPFSKDRLKGLRRELTNLQTDFPAIVGLSLYGSMTKGYVTEESDVDIFVFVDIDRMTVEQEYKEKYGLKFGEDVSIRVAERLGITPDFSLSTLFMNRSSLSADVETLARELHWLYGRHGNAVIPRLQARPRWPTQLIGPMGRLSPLFTGISINTSGLRDFRRYLLAELGKKGEDGEKIWQVLILYVMRFERPEVISDQLKLDTIRKLYPQSLDEAMRYYHLV